MTTARRLDAGELAEAAVLCDVGLILALAGWFLPFGTALFLAATVPFAVLAARRRLRAVIIGCAAVGQVAFLLGGVNFELNLAATAAIGIVVGWAYRAGWRRGGTVAVAVVVLWIPGAALTLAFLALFAESRKLTLEQIDIGTRGARNALRQLGDEETARRLDDVVRWFIAHWWLVIPLVELVAVVALVLLARRIAVPALRRIDATFARPAPHDSHLAPAERAADPAPAPVPVALDEVVVAYRPDGPPALRGLTVTIEPGEFVAVVGDNGSGKSTLARVLAGRPPTSGTVDRPGAAGLGRPGGTAIVAQRPESQVLGVRVRDDVLWGLTAADASHVDVDALLARVGLESFSLRETATLSGGELQRLAIAAALARRPALLLSDESTAMVDPAGRRQLVALLRSLADDGIAVVHVTHDLEETAAADRVVTLADGVVVGDREPEGRA